MLKGHSLFLEENYLIHSGAISEKEVAIMANTKRFTEGLPDELGDLMSVLGANLRVARKRRRMSIAAMAKTIMVSPPTVRKLEAGDPTISFGIVVAALWTLGMAGKLKGLAAPETDEIGLRAELARLGRGREIKDERDF